MDIDNDIVDKECRQGKYKYTFLWFTLEQPNMVTGIKLKCQTVFVILVFNFVCMMSSFTAFYFQNKQ